MSDDDYRTGVRVLLKQPPPPKPVPGVFMTRRVAESVVIPTATSWKGLDGGALRVYSDQSVVAEFAAGEWVAVVDNAVSPEQVSAMARQMSEQLEEVLDPNACTCRPIRGGLDVDKHCPSHGWTS